MPDTTKAYLKPLKLHNPRTQVPTLYSMEAYSHGQIFRRMELAWSYVCEDLMANSFVGYRHLIDVMELGSRAGGPHNAISRSAARELLNQAAKEGLIYRIALTATPNAGAARSNVRPRWVYVFRNFRVNEFPVPPDPLYPERALPRIPPPL